jgi:hypothetical protein
MSKKKECESTNWRINYRDRKEYYESQQAALDAVDLIISSYESGIRSRSNLKFDERALRGHRSKSASAYSVITQFLASDDRIFDTLSKFDL